MNAIHFAEMFGNLAPVFAGSWWEVSLVREESLVRREESLVRWEEGEDWRPRLAEETLPLESERKCE